MFSWIHVERKSDHSFQFASHSDRFCAVVHFRIDRGFLDLDQKTPIWGTSDMHIKGNPEIPVKVHVEIPLVSIASGALCPFSRLTRPAFALHDWSPFLPCEEIFAPDYSSKVSIRGHYHYVPLRLRQ